ncbi:hypothetical protein BJ878DRAFT_478684 [Calycina marina]|uniref:Uncharacterized protein n=1 Tax=Calycina marina TaxID=1763456 RepID=A0A9P7Z5N9_9HELO|nr:hypothetical protein BJ878DRAFT_478684 [Calycina marina]
MSGASDSASMEAKIGSATYNYTQSKYYVQHPYADLANVASRPRQPYSQQSDGSATAYYQNHAARTSRNNGCRSNHASPASHSPFHEIAENDWESRYVSPAMTSQETYYLFRSSNENETNSYPSEITLEEEYEEPSSNTQHRQASPPHFQTRQNRNRSSHANEEDRYSEQASDTTNTWFLQQLPEERLRLGLPRWESDKQRHATYEKTHLSQ